MLNNLQILRAFAALNVVMFHIIAVVEESGSHIPGLMFLKGWGANGIDIFFILSGFIMVYIAEKRPRNPGEFLTNRVVRIVPIYWILTAVGCLAIFAAGDFRGEPISIDAMLSSFAFLTRWTTLDMPILYVGWTLEWEMLFYLIFGVSLFLKSKTAQFILPLMVLLGLVVFAGQDPIILEFGFGMILAKIYKIQAIKSKAAMFAALGTAGLLASIWIKPDLPQIILWGVPSVFLILGLVNLKQWNSKVGVHLGNASYSIYLIQVFTIPIFYKIANKVTPDLPPFLLAMGCLLATAIAGSLCHLIVEKPVHKFVTRKAEAAPMPSYDKARLRAVVENKETLSRS